MFSLNVHNSFPPFGCHYMSSQQVFTQKGVAIVGNLCVFTENLPAEFLEVVKTNWMLIFVYIKYIAFQLQIYHDKSEIDALFGLRSLIGCTAASVTTVCAKFTGSDTQTGSSCVTWLLRTTDAGCTTTTGSATHPRSRHFWNKYP